VASTGSEGRCARCNRQDALYADREDGKNYCGECMFLPGPLYGPGYQWEGSASSSDEGCESVLGWICCTLSTGHGGLHEGWDGEGGDPLAAWDDDQIAWFDAARRDRWRSPDAGRQEPGPGYLWQGSGLYDSAMICGQPAMSGRGCTLHQGHHGIHECWRSGYNAPLEAWRGSRALYTRAYGWRL
jgi:hypothetical protein